MTDKRNKTQIITLGVFLFVKIILQVFNNKNNVALNKNKMSESARQR